MNRRDSFKNGAYRMVFSKDKTKNAHNKLNLRDTSTEPSNLYGDRNIPREESKLDLNDRAQDSEPDSDDGPPPLETAFTSPENRRRLASERRQKVLEES